MQAPCTQIVERQPVGVFLTLGAMNYKKEAGRRLRAAREAKGLTLQELSKRLGGVLSPSRLSNYEQGIRQIGVRESLALHGVLGVQPAHLLCVDVGDEEMTSQEQQLLRDFRALPERDRNDYARRIEVLALAYKEPVPDEKLSAAVRKGAPRRTAQK